MWKPGSGFVASSISTNVLAAVAFSVDSNLGSIVTCLIATVAVVLAVLNFLDRRIKEKDDELEKRMDEKHKANIARFEDLKGDMSDLKKMFISYIGRSPREGE